MKLLLLNLNPSTHRSDKDVTFSYIIYMLDNITGDENTQRYMVDVFVFIQH